ncbi:hypothetical protein C5B41_13775 [Acinetobacter ursingii]|uniref:hypothetical protein n=1 Tax=Acinetobacter ursingii TaxID=108980 RepID=UPI000CF249D7|nr:hypothetical protein [Acinetobacter ursingii]PPZ93783.1 hypothetical protein C5B41_13775 [Acinetobacter ursingii]
MKFPKNLISDMYDSNVSFEQILHIPSLTASDAQNVSDQFSEFLGDAYEDWTSKSLLKQCPALEATLTQIRDNDQIEQYARDVISDFYHACGELEFLILISIRIPFNFKFTEDGKYRSNSLGGAFRQQWILAKNMIAAAETAIQRAEELHQQEEQKARKEQGLEG